MSLFQPGPNMMKRMADELQLLKLRVNRMRFGTSSGAFQVPPPIRIVTATLASDALTVDPEWGRIVVVTLLPQSGDTDTLSDINGAVGGQLLIFRVPTGKTITIDAAVVNFIFTASASGLVAVVLDDEFKSIAFLCFGGTTFIEQWRSNNIVTATASAHDHTTGDGSGVLTNDEHDGYSQITQISAPGAPASTKHRVYVDSADGRLKIKHPDASVQTLEDHLIASKTLASDAFSVDPTWPNFTVVTLTPEGGGASDTLSDINGATDGQIIVITPASGKTITLDGNVANLLLTSTPSGTGDVILNNVQHFMAFLFTGTIWYEVFRSQNLMRVEHTIRIPLVKPLLGPTNNDTLDNAYCHRGLGTACLIDRWYIRFEANLSISNATFELRKNGSAISGASITVNSGSSDAAVDTFTAVSLAEGDTLEVWQTAGGAETKGGSAYVIGVKELPIW